MRASRFGLAGAALATAALVAPFGGGARAASDPDRISVGFGGYDSIVFQPSTDTPRNRSLDLRVEYRFGHSLLPVTEPYVRFHPWVGVEGTSDGMLYGGGGLLADVPIGPIVLTPSFGAGLWRRGGSKNLGAGLEFRSMMEVGYELDSGWRVSAYLSHISNGGITRKNPGVNTAGAYLHIPVHGLFGNP